MILCHDKKILLDVCSLNLANVKLRGFCSGGEKLIMQGKYKGIASWIGGYGKVTGHWSRLCPSDENDKLGVVGRF